jgi:MFS family permease
VFFVTMTYGTVVSFLALYAQTMNVTNVGPFFTMYAITLMITRPLFGRIADKKGFDNCYAAGYSLCPSNNANSFCSAQPARIYVGSTTGLQHALSLGMCTNFDFPDFLLCHRTRTGPAAVLMKAFPLRFQFALKKPCCLIVWASTVSCCSRTFTSKAWSKG